MMLRRLGIIEFMLRANNSHLIMSQQQRLWGQITSFCTYLSDLEIKEKQKKSKTVIISKITLIHTDSSVTINNLEEARRIAKRKNLQLRLISETSKSGRRVHQLVDAFTENDVNKTKTPTQKVKSIKHVLIKSRITINDLTVKIRNINTSLRKNNCVIVKVIIDDNENQNKIFEMIKSQTQGKLSYETKKKKHMEFQFFPLLKDFPL